jgi:hypothetical protein
LSLSERQHLSKKKAVVSHCISLKAILQGTAHLPFNGKEISNPWDSQNLSGIACLIHERFHKRSFVSFNNHLLDAMGFNLSEADTRQASSHESFHNRSADDFPLGLSQPLDPNEP